MTVLGAAALVGSPLGSDELSSDSEGVVSELLPEAEHPGRGVVETDLPVDSPLATSVARVLPAGTEVVSVTERVDTIDRRGVDAVELSTVRDWSGYEVTVYRTFAADELAGLPTSEDASGRTWIAATDQDLTSIYHLSGGGVGLRVAHLSRDSPARVDELEAIAVALAADPVVVEEASP